ncbi:MAG: hypothetical protein WDA27_03045 [Actinomycetota bacterium]
MLCMLMHLLHGRHEDHAEGTAAGHAEPADAREILRARYARGEITEEQLTHMLGVLSGSASAGS